jgi:ferritin-like metal-binding protein YciE
MTTRTPYKKRLREHLTETKRHARELERRVKKMLKNAKSEYADEHEEIATYTAIEIPAEALGDADTARLAIEKFSATGTFLKAYGKEGSGELQFKEPKGIAFDSEGYVFIADAGNKRI